jgi:hypothetical protein
MTRYLGRVISRPTKIGLAAMKDANTGRNGNQLPVLARALLRSDRGALTRVARRFRPGVSLSHVSKVAAGKRSSARVVRALIAEARRIAIRRGYERALEIEELARR